MQAPTGAANAGGTTPPMGQSSGGWILSRAAREIRLGLVVYGGVSLAIYINGIAEELFRTVRGRGIYKLLKRLLDSDIVVDIISGTSAGGINGLFLAYALTNEREFSDCATLWREEGSLTKLLRLIDDEAHATSLLDSRNRYLPQLERAFRSMGAIAGTIRRLERPSTFDELDLFATGTNYDGQLSAAVDATGRHIEIKTHRTVFQLKHRRGRKTPFAFPLAAEARTDSDRARVAALARLAAITSCFPAAFEPVKVAPAPSNPFEQKVYEYLSEWGKLTGETWFLDGGVLDNKPFSYTIHEIFHRTASRPVDRKLFYVEPDPERFQADAKTAREQPPNAVQSAVQALFGVPGYESIAEDLQQIFKRNDRLERLGRARNAAERALWELKASGAPSADAIPPSVAAIYKHTRLTQLSSRAVKGLMVDEEAERGAPRAAGEHSRIAAKREQARREVAAALAKAFNEWEGNGEATLQRYDVYQKRRRLFHVIYRVFGQVSRLCDAASDDTKAADEAQSLKHVWEQLNAQLGAYEIVEWAMGRALDLRPMPRGVAKTAESARAVWTTLAADFERLLAIDADLEPAFQADAFSDEWRDKLYKTLSVRLKAATTPVGAHPQPSTGGDDGKNLLERLEEQSERLVAAASARHPEVAVAWADFPWYDAHFFPIDYFGDLAEKDPIEVVRVSPLDAERGFSNRNFEDKITGETVMHFGGFLKKSWRSNDIMWGRLDAVCRLLDALLQPEALGRAVENPEVRALLRADLNGPDGEPGELHPKTLFPNAGAAIQNDVYAWLRNLASEDQATRTLAVRDPKTSLDGPDKPHYELLLWCAQLEILHENLPTVLADATTEQLEWNNLRAERGFRRMGLRIDRATGRLMGKQVTAEFLETLRKDPSEFTEIPNAPIAKYFLKEYAVGSESVSADIPPSVLLETITATSLVARNCLLNACPNRGEKLRSNMLYKALVHWPMMTAHMLAVLARRERTLYVAALAALFTYATVALIGGVFWLRVSVRTDDGMSNSRMVFLVVLPIVILVVGGYMGWLFVLRHAGRTWSAVLARGALAVISAAAAIPMLLALVAAWGETNNRLREWFAAAPSNTVARMLLPDVFLQWLANSVSGEGWRQVTFYPLVLLLVVALIVVPLIRGFIHSRVTRRSARFVVEDHVEALVGKCAEVTRAARATIRSRTERGDVRERAVK